MTGTCELCGRTEIALTEHHLIPRARHNKAVRRDYGGDRNKVAMICRPCHSQIHGLFTEKELERKYSTIELLKAHPDVIKWIEWVSKRPNWRG